MLVDTNLVTMESEDLCICFIQEEIEESVQVRKSFRRWYKEMMRSVQVNKSKDDSGEKKRKMISNMIFCALLKSSCT